MKTPHESADQRLAVLTWLAFVLLTLPRLLLHELWRDEAWLWLVVTESKTLTDLFEPLARSGQGYLFPLLCAVASRIWTSPLALQLLHLILAATAAFVFVRWAPLTRSQRLLFVLGYFPFYEYAVISRHYALGALLVWLACALIRGSGSVVVLGVVLGLLCQTTVYGFLLAGVLACAAWLDRKSRLRPVSRAALFTGLALLLAGALSGLLQLMPAPGTSFAPEWHLAWNPIRVLQVLALPWNAFVPLPRPEITFWNTNLLDGWPPLRVVGGLLILALACALLWRQKLALRCFLLGTAGVLAFGYVKYIGVLRHYGHLWLLFAAALWLGGAEDVRQPGTWRARLLQTLLLVHVLAAGAASWLDLRYPFSNGAAIAERLQVQGLADHPLLGHREPPAATVSLYLGRPLYSPSRKIFTTRPDWGPEQHEISPQQLRCAARRLARLQGREIVLVLNTQAPAWEELQPAGSAQGAIQKTEDYFLYRLHPDHLADTAQAAQCPEER